MPVFGMALQHLAQDVADALALVGVVRAENVADALFRMTDPLVDQQFEVLVETLLRMGMEGDDGCFPFGFAAVIAHLPESGHFPKHPMLIQKVLEVLLLLPS